LTALINLIQDLISNIIQLKKYKLGMKVDTLIRKACDYLGLQFSSPVLTGTYANLTICPSKTVIPSLSNPLNVFDRPFDENQGFPFNPDVYGHYDGTFKDLLIDFLSWCNGKVIINNGQLIIREKHDYNTVGTFIPPNVDNPGNTFNLPEPFRTNASELPANLYLTYAVDETELNTIHKYRGTSVNVTLVPTVVNTKGNVLLGNGQEVRLAFAHAKRKEYLTRIENLLNGLINAVASVVNFVLGAINGLINAINWAISLFGGSSTTLAPIPLMPTNILNNRIGWMLLSNDSFSIPKLFIGTPVGSDWEIAANNETDMAAINLLNNFHGKELATRGNQALIYRDRTFKFCCKDYYIVRGNNIFQTPAGYFGKFTKIPWDLHNEIAVGAEYRIFINFTNNLTEKITEDGAR
jgi:hypothetical protein